MNELVRQFVIESKALLDKQAAEIKALKEELGRVRAIELTKAAEDVLGELADALETGAFTKDSVVRAVRGGNADLLEKEAVLDEDSDSDWGTLENGSIKRSADLSRLKQSERRLYERMGIL